jgi:hypothetical protein
MIIVLLCWIPYPILGGNGSFRIHDNLDGIHAAYKLLNVNNLFLSNSFIINGVRRGSLPLEFNISTWLYLLFGPLKSYIVERLIISLVGYLGMYRLLSTRLLKGEKQIITVGVSLCFALLPFWPYGGIGISGIPLLVCAFWNFYEGNWNWRDLLVLLIYAFYSSLIFTGFFILIYCLMILLLGWFKQGKLNFQFLLGICFLVLFYIVSHYRLFTAFLFDTDYISHRVEFKIHLTGIKQSLKTGWWLFLNQQTHSESLHQKVILPLYILTLFFIKSPNRFKELKFSIVVLFVLVMTALFYGLYQSKILQSFTSLITSIIPMQFDRFYMLSPVLWYVLFAFTLKILWNTDTIRKSAIYFLIFFQFLIVLANHELIVNRNNITYHDFYAEKTFAKIKNELNKINKDYKVISVGLDPVIAQFNGFKTIDAYFSDYPLKEKHDFRKIIAGELNRNEELRQYFDDWGSRKYIFSSELRKGHNHIDTLSLNYKVLKNQKIQFLLSSVLINETINPLKLLKYFENKNKKIYVYIFI